MEANYLVVELEGPVVDVDLLKLEVVDEVLEHVRHPDPAAEAPSAPPTPHHGPGVEPHWLCVRAE